MRDVYTSSPEEIEWAGGLTRSDEHRLVLVVLLKCFQRLGYFPALAAVPTAVVDRPSEFTDGLRARLAWRPAWTRATPTTPT